MCFSATASFTAGVILTAAGILTLKEVRRKQELLFAFVPLLFAAQQFIEGFLWLALLEGNSAAVQSLTQAYVAFVGIIWPLVVPAGILLIEPERTRRPLILLILALGLAAALHTIHTLATSGINAVIVNNCIRYDRVIKSEYPLVIPYFIATSTAFFCSSRRIINIIGIMNAMAFLIAYYVYEANFVSGWCFLAAVVGGLIYFHFSRARR